VSSQTNKKQCTIAVCVISYNQRDYLIEVIDSILAQTRMPDQIIVIDDVSTDDSVEVLRRYEQDHPWLFTIKVNETNQGIGRNRYFGVKESRCDLTTYVDGDDLYYPDKLRLEELCLNENPDAGFVYSNLKLIDSNSNTIRNWTKDAAKELPSGSIFETVAAQEFPGGIQCRFPLTNTQALIDATYHAQGFNLYEDLIIMMQLSRSMKCAVVPEINLGYRLHDRCIHRSHYDRHLNTLEAIYAQNQYLLDRLEPDVRNRIEKKRNRILSKYAWRAVKDHAKSPAIGSKKRTIELAKSAMQHDLSATRPKHIIRVLATQFKSEKAPSVDFSL
jgi:glycosyltransferase involved in cell wall biosynthesis